ncbi:MAG TPA: DUF6525 family protein [Roseiarcus sp.]|jgi:hypothetical protein
MSASNGRGSYRTTRANVMAAFDKLPPEVRQALANADGNYVPQPLLTNLRRGSPLSYVLALVEIWDRERKRKGRRP